MPIKIVPHNPAWFDDFSRLKAAILPVLPPDARIHHIGSTAVPGLAAKDIIDIQVTVNALSDINPIALEPAGFEHRPHATDHCPPGITLSHADLAKLMFARAAPRAAHLHIRQVGRFNQRYALLCRDYLRAHPLAAAAYGKIKENLAARFPEDAEAYYAIKDPVFDLLMAGAEDWASTTRWHPPASD